MKTAEVAIEHVLTGLLAVCAFVLPFLANANICLSGAEGLVGILGIAYLLGVVFDRLADTILNPFEGWLRLKKAEANLNEQAPCVNGDPFPQAALEFSLRKAQDGRLEWMDSLRSRIRTARGLAAYGLPATLGVVTYGSLAWQGNPAATVPLLWWPHAFVALNLLLAALSVWAAHRRRRDLTRTDRLPAARPTRSRTMSKARRHMVARALPYSLMLISSATATGFIAAAQADLRALTGIGISGTVCALSALWAWQRITRTYLNFIYRELPNLPVDDTR